MAQGNLARPTSNIPLSRYPKSDKAFNFIEWGTKRKPLLYSSAYFTEKKIGDVVYTPTQQAAVIVNNFSSQTIQFGVWKIFAENKEAYPNQENYMAYCFNTSPFLKGELSPDDTSCAAFLNQHIRVFADVLGDSYDQAADSNTLIKGTNEANSVDLLLGFGHVLVCKKDNGTQSVLPCIASAIVQDSSLRPGQIIVQKDDNATDISVNIKITQSGITLPTKFSTIDAGLQSYMLEHTPDFLFALYKADEPQREMIASKIYVFTLNQAIIVTDAQQDPSSVQINVVSKAGCQPYLV